MVTFRMVPPGGKPDGSTGSARASAGEHSAPAERSPFSAGVPLGAIVPRKFTESPELVVLRHSRSTLAERFRMLVTRLENAVTSTGAPVRLVVVTSAVPGEGKTTTATNLALAMAEDRSRSVLLVDADLRRPAVGRYLTPEPRLGLSEVLSGAAPLDHALLEVKEARITVLPSGNSVTGPLELLRSDYLATVLGELRRRFDRIVIDSPPTVPFADAAVLNSRADGALLVVRAGHVPKAMVHRALESLSGGLVLGAVLNDVEATAVDRYYYRYDDHDPDRYAARSHDE